MEYNARSSTRSGRRRHEHSRSIDSTATRRRVAGQRDLERACVRQQRLDGAEPVCRRDRAGDRRGARPHPLALYLFDDSTSRQERVLQSTLAGGVSINETLMHIAQDSLPFGGVGASGMGHYHGRFGFDTMSKLKPVFRQSRINGMGLLAPPYGALFKRMVKLMLRN